MITRLIWTIWTPMSSVPKKADKLNLSLSDNNTVLNFYLLYHWLVSTTCRNVSFRMCVMCAYSTWHYKGNGSCKTWCSMQCALLVTVVRHCSSMWWHYNNEILFLLPGLCLGNPLVTLLRRGQWCVQLWCLLVITIYKHLNKLSSCWWFQMP